MPFPGDVGPPPVAPLLINGKPAEPRYKPTEAEIAERRARRAELAKQALAPDDHSPPSKNVLKQQLRKLESEALFPERSRNDKKHDLSCARFLRSSPSADADIDNQSPSSAATTPSNKPHTVALPLNANGAPEPLLGPDKFLGGALSSVDGCIYGVPGHSKRVLKIDPATDTVSLLDDRGKTYDGIYKWLRACEGPNQKLYGIPSHAAEVLVIDPAKQCTALLAHQDGPMEVLCFWGVDMIGQKLSL